MCVVTDHTHTRPKSSIRFSILVCPVNWTSKLALDLGLGCTLVGQVNRVDSNLGPNFTALLVLLDSSFRGDSDEDICGHHAC